LKYAHFRGVVLKTSHPIDFKYVCTRWWSYWATSSKTKTAPCGVRSLKNATSSNSGITA